MFRVLGFFTWTDGAAAPVAAVSGGMMMMQTGYIRRGGRNIYKVAWGDLCNVWKLLYLGYTKVASWISARQSTNHSEIRDIVGSPRYGLGLH